MAQIRLSQDGARANLTFARPESLNALSPTLIEETLLAVEETAASPARVLVIAGEGRSFSAGVDLKAAPGLSRDAAKAFSDNARRLVTMLETMPQVVIARVTGHCFTGALEIALGCDFILAAEDAVFADTHAKLGMRPGWGLSQRLPRRIGQQRAREMSFAGRRLNGREAQAIGLILEALPAERLDARIDELVGQIAQQSRDAIAAYKQLYRAAETRTLDDGLAFEAGARFKISDASDRRRLP